MESIVYGLVLMLLLLLLLGLGTWIFSAILILSTVSLLIFLDFPVGRVGIIAKTILFRSSSAWELSAVPLFVGVGELIFRTDISERLFKGLTPFVNRIPGRLLHTNIAGCTLFAAVSGSSTATTASVGKITTVALSDRKYDTNLSLGSLAGAGGLGLLIPPSVIMIVYGILGEVSISKLFTAGFIPGFLLTGLYSLYIVVRCVINPSLAPKAETFFSWKDKFTSLLNLLPVLILIIIVLGGIYSGIATPSEAAAVAYLATVIMALVMRQLTWSLFKESVLGTVRISCMICSLMAAASLLSTVMGYLHIPGNVAKFIVTLELNKYELILVLSLFYILLGLFLDGISITVMTLPITLPLIKQAGFDPVWFGVFLVIMIELALITPPVGFNLFVLQGMTGHPIEKIAFASLPFFVLMCLGTIIITIFPMIVLWLPKLLLS